MSCRVVTNEPQKYAAWALQYCTDVRDWGPCWAIGLERDGVPVAAVVYNMYTDANVSMSFAAVPGRRWLNRAFLRAMFEYPFTQLGVRRVTGFVAKKNTDSRRFAEHLGAKREGVMKHALPHDDVVIYRILASECKWHNLRVPDEQRQFPAAAA